MTTTLRWSMLGLLVVALGAGEAFAAVCPVPSGAHPTIQTAIDDGACTEIAVSPRVYPEGLTIDHDVILDGGSSQTTTIAGQVNVSSGFVTLRGLTIDTGSGLSADALVVGSGGQVSGDDLVVDDTGSVVFADGFEGGDVTQWTNTIP